MTRRWSTGRHGNESPTDTCCTVHHTQLQATRVYPSRHDTDTTSGSGPERRLKEGGDGRNPPSCGPEGPVSVPPESLRLARRPSQTQTQNRRTYFRAETVDGRHTLTGPGNWVGLNVTGEPRQRPGVYTEKARERRNIVISVRDSVVPQR